MPIKDFITLRYGFCDCVSLGTPSGRIRTRPREIRRFLKALNPHRCCLLLYIDGGNIKSPWQARG